MPSKPKWTPEQDDELEKGHEEGLSASQIANRVNEKHGTQYSRNAVIGRCNRLGLKTLNRPHVDQPARKRSPRPRIIVFKPAPPLAPEPSDPSSLVAFADLRKHHCRWPSGSSPNMLFCGAPALDGQSWCAWHCRMAFVPPEQRKRARVWR